MQGRESGEDKQREESEGLEAEKNGASGVGLHSPTFFLFSFSSFDFFIFFFSNDFGFSLDTLTGPFTGPLVVRAASFGLAASLPRSSTGPQGPPRNPLQSPVTSHQSLGPQFHWSLVPSREVGDAVT